MRHRVFLPLFVLLVVLGCAKKEEPAATATVSAPATTAVAPAPATESAATTTTAVATPAAPSGGSIASQDTNWSGVVAEVTEFRRKGNTLTAKVRLTNRGTAQVEPDIVFREVYLIDTGAGKKYEILKDEKDVYIASNLSGWNNRWYGKLQPGQSHNLWMKFPAPPAEVKAITLQLPNTAPFEDVPIQD